MKKLLLLFSLLLLFENAYCQVHKYKVVESTTYDKDSIANKNKQHNTLVYFNFNEDKIDIYGKDTTHIHIIGYNRLYTESNRQPAYELIGVDRGVKVKIQMSYYECMNWINSITEDAKSPNYKGIHIGADMLIRYADSVNTKVSFKLIEIH